MKGVLADPRARSAWAKQVKREAGDSGFCAKLHLGSETCMETREIGDDAGGECQMGKVRKQVSGKYLDRVVAALKWSFLTLVRAYLTDT